MSLINKVLLDLESRTPNGDACTETKTVFADLQAVGVSAPGIAPKWLFIAIAGIIILAAAGAVGYYKFVRQEQVAEPVASMENIVDRAITVEKPAGTPANHKDIASPEPSPLLVADNPHTMLPIEEVPASPSPAAETAIMASAANQQTTASPPAATVTSKGVPAEILAKADLLPHREKPPVEEPHATAAIANKDDSRFERTLHPLSPAETAENLYRKGVTLFRLGKSREGEQALRAALVADPAHAGARETLAMVFLEGKRFEEAKKILSEGIALLPGYAPFSYRLARLYVEQGDEAGALSLLEAHRARTAPDAAYLGLLATLYQRASRHEEARDVFRQALALRGDESRWWTGLGISLEVLHDWAAARDAYQHSILNTQTEPRVRRYAEQRLAAVDRHLLNK